MQDYAHALEVGIDVFFEKPVRIEEYLAAVRPFLSSGALTAVP
jgi:hypothetical protein